MPNAKCFACGLFPQDPVGLACACPTEEIYCWECLAKRTRCSVCCTQIEFEKVEPMQRCSRNCGNYFPVGKSAAHDLTCTQNLVACPLPNCGSKMEVGKLQIHITEDCPFRITDCIHCDEMVFAKDQAEHDKVCANQKQKCERCGALVVRKDLPQHVAQCVGVNCFCAANISKSELNAHLASELDHHFHLLNNKQKKMNIRLKRLELCVGGIFLLLIAILIIPILFSGLFSKLLSFVLIAFGVVKFMRGWKKLKRKALIEDPEKLSALKHQDGSPAQRSHLKSSVRINKKLLKRMGGKASMDWMLQRMSMSSAESQTK